MNQFSKLQNSYIKINIVRHQVESYKWYMLSKFRIEILYLLKEGKKEEEIHSDSTLKWLSNSNKGFVCFASINNRKSLYMSS